jgi:hypothetical protein
MKPIEFVPRMGEEGGRGVMERMGSMGGILCAFMKIS